MKRHFNYKFALVSLGVFLFLLFQFVIIRRIYITQTSKDLNLLLISVDTLRADHMGIYGYPKNTTPNIDKWVKDAIVFTNMHTTTPLTYPSFATLMTGKSPFESKIYNNLGVVDGKLLAGGHPLKDADITLAEILKSHNFTTAAFITSYMLQGSMTNLSKGFDVYNFTDSFATDRQGYENFINESLIWLDKNKNKKFFSWIHLMDPHFPYAPPDNLSCEFSQSFCKIIQDSGTDVLEKERKRLEGCQADSIAKEKVELFESLYNGEVAYTDRLVEKILNKLSETGLDKKTIVVFYGDHGEGFDHNYFFDHGGVLYESATRIPFVIKHPVLPFNGKKVDALVENAQILPTILDMLSVKYNNNKSLSSTQSLVNLFSTNSNPRVYKEEHYIYSTTGSSEKYAIQNNQFKMIYSLPESCLMYGETEELYDLKEDPQERKNLVSEKPDIAKNLKQKLFSFLAKYGLPKRLMQLDNSEVSVEQQKAIDKIKSLGY